MIRILPRVFVCLTRQQSRQESVSEASAGFYSFDRVDAQDLTQQFFARFLERKYLERADSERGRFRSFLLTSLKHFLVNEWEKTRAQKRGGGTAMASWDGFDPDKRYRLEPGDTLAPDRIYEKRWAATLLDGLLARLGDEYQAAGRLFEFDQLKSFVWGDGEADSYAEVAARLGIEGNAPKWRCIASANDFASSCGRKCLARFRRLLKWTKNSVIC